MKATNMSALTVPTNAEIIAELVHELIDVQRIAPFKFGIYYNANEGPARVPVHKITNGGTMGQVEFASATASRMWCGSALKEGYTVARIMGRGDVLADFSVSRRRRYYEQRIKLQSMTPAQRKADDDSIPF